MFKYNGSFLYYLIDNLIILLLQLHGNPPHGKMIVNILDNIIKMMYVHKDIDVSVRLITDLQIPVFWNFRYIDIGSVDISDFCHAALHSGWLHIFCSWGYLRVQQILPPGIEGRIL